MAQLFVISAPSGTGKTSLINKVLHEELASKAKLGISCTTREKRKNEEEGIAYFFLTEEEFNKKIKEDGFLEYANVFGISSVTGEGVQELLDDISRKIFI